MTMGPRYRGWHWDDANTRLDVYIGETEVAYFDDSAPYLTLANQLTVSTGGITVTAGGITITAGALTVNSDIVMNTSAKAIKTGTSNNDNLSIQVYDTNASGYGTVLKAQAVTSTSYELGFFDKCTTQVAHVATVAAGATGTTAINSILSGLEALGLFATG